MEIELIETKNHKKEFTNYKEISDIFLNKKETIINNNSEFKNELNGQSKIKIGDIVNHTNQYYQNLGLEKNLRKKIEGMIVKLGGNVMRHSDQKLPADITTYIKTENNQNYICVKTTNYAQNIEQKEYLETLLKNINNKDKNEVEKAYLKQITTRELADQTKGLGLIALGKNNKNLNNEKPFEYSFDEVEIKGEKKRAISITCKTIVQKTGKEKNTEKHEYELI